MRTIFIAAVVAVLIPSAKIPDKLTDAATGR